VPEGVQNENIAWRIAVLGGLDTVPAATVNRFRASSLQAARIAVHAVRSGEGDVFLVGGVESVSHRLPADLQRHPAFDHAGDRAQEVFASGAQWTDRKRFHVAAGCDRIHLVALTSPDVPLMACQPAAFRVAQKRRKLTR
jgi:acetyl-CoA C-acetyltransferase